MPFTEWLNLNCNCSLVRAVQWAVSAVMKICDVPCVFEWDTSLLAFLSRCLLPLWPFRPGQLIDCYIFSSLHNEEVITLPLVDFTNTQTRRQRVRGRDRIRKEYRKYNLLLLSIKQTFLQPASVGIFLWMRCVFVPAYLKGWVSKLLVHVVMFSIIPHFLKGIKSSCIHL